MKIDLSLTEEQFHQLLSWLDADPARAGEKYEEIRQTLIKIFLNRQCEEAEDLADQTINRVARKVSKLKDKYVGEDRARYFYGVAKKIYMEHRRKSKRPPPLPPPPPPSRDELEPRLVCLDECLGKLDPASRELILSYYEEEKQAKIFAHREMSERLHLNPGALRARTHRIRAKLENCILECLERTGQSNNIELVTI